MVQIFDVHCIHGLPKNSSIKDLYDPVTDSRESASLLPVSYPSASSPGSQTVSFADLCQRSRCTSCSRSLSLTAVYIASDPAGAQIFINGIEQTGFRTPSMITDLPSGYNNIKLISPGYIDIESSIPLESGRTYNVFLTMEKAQESTYSSSGIIILLALGLGFLLLRNQKII